jgi:hypothetical protein
LIEQVVAEGVWPAVEMVQEQYSFLEEIVVERLCDVPVSPIRH